LCTARFSHNAQVFLKLPSCHQGCLRRRHVSRSVLRCYSGPVSPTWYGVLQRCGIPARIRDPAESPCCPTANVTLMAGMEKDLQPRTSRCSQTPAFSEKVIQELKI
jgi:hypothetical protein